jgi:hypothetical protein
VRPGAVAGDPLARACPERGASVRARQQLGEAVRERAGVERRGRQARDLIVDYLLERPDRADHDRQSARHRLDRLQRRDQLADPVRGARDDEHIENRVILADRPHRHPAGEDRVHAELGGLTLERGAFGAVADDQCPGGDVAVVEDLDRLQQRADPLVRDQAGDEANDVLAVFDAEGLPEGGAVGERAEELLADAVGDDDHLVLVDPAGQDLLAHRLAERHHQVGGQHAVRLEGAGARVAVAAREVLGGGVAGQPGVLPEAAHLVDDRQPGRVAQGQGDERVGVVGRGVQDGRLEIGGEAGGIPQVRLVEGVHPAGHDPRQQPVVGDAVHGDPGPAVDRARRDGEADPGGDVRVEAHGPLGQRDLLRSDRVAGVGRRQRVGDEVQDTAFGGVSRAFRAFRLLGGERQPSGLKHLDLGADRLPQPSGPPAGSAVEFAHRVRQPSLTVGEPGREPGARRVVHRQADQGRPGDRGLIHRQAEGGQLGRRPFQGGERAAAVPRAPRSGGFAVGAGEPQQAAQRCGQRPPGERHRAHRVVGHVPQHHGGGEYDRSGRRLYSHAGRY